MEINNFQENARKDTHNYAVGDMVYLEMTGMYPRLDYKKQGSNIIT